MHADPKISRGKWILLAVRWPLAPRDELPNVLVLSALSLRFQISPYLFLSAIMISVLILCHFIRFHHVLSATTFATALDLFSLSPALKATHKSTKLLPSQNRCKYQVGKYKPNQHCVLLSPNLPHPSYDVCHKHQLSFVSSGRLEPGKSV